MISEYKFNFCSIASTPPVFDREKFMFGDEDQQELYKNAKKVNQTKVLSFKQVSDTEVRPNFARFIPKGCMFIDFDDADETEIMRRIIVNNKLKCWILKTQHGYHFLFKIPEFIKTSSKEITKGINWLGFHYDFKCSNDKKEAVQIMRVCGMSRQEFYSLEPEKELGIRESINLEDLDELPYWLWGKKTNKDLFKGGKYKKDGTVFTLEDTPFIKLEKMSEGSRHNYIFETCSRFAVYNGFTLDEFKAIINVIHDEFLSKIGSSMSESDLLGDIEERWEGYEAELLGEGHYDFDEKTRTWTKVKKSREDKMDERRAAEYLFNQFDFYGTNKDKDGKFTKLLYRNKEGYYNYSNDLTQIRGALRDYNPQNFKESFLKETEVQLMQMCAENNKTITRTDKYIITKNKVLSCIMPDAYDFDWLDGRTPTDVVLPWNWYSEEWVAEHEEDLGGNITKFIKQLARDSTGKTQPEVEQWLWIIAGASMIPANQLQKIVILEGGGQNGKSLYTSLIRLCLGDDMYNTSKIFDSSPTDNFWGEGLDRGILCVVDDLIDTYNKSAFSYLKGAITGTDCVIINEKFKAKRELHILPQIIACTNFEFKLYDKTEGMKRRVLILPTEYHISDLAKDLDLEHKLVLNTLDKKEIADYKMTVDSYGNLGRKVMYMYPKEKGVLDSLDNGSLAWFANKARYMYFKWLYKDIVPGTSLTMKAKFESAFSGGFEDSPKRQCEKFLKWYLTNKCGGTNPNKFDLSLANSFYEILYRKDYIDFCKIMGFEKMEEKQFKFNFSKLVNKYFLVKKKKNDKGISLPYIYFDKPPKHKKK